MKHNTTIRAIDIGYGNTKFVISASGSQIECDLLPSRAPLHSQSAMGGNGAISGRRNELVEVDGKWYEVGLDTELFKGPAILHDNYTDTPEYLALYRAGLGKMRTDSIGMMITGLPVSQLKEKKDALSRRLIGKHPVPGDRQVDVHGVNVFAQPLGGLVDYCLLRDGGWRKEHEDSVHLLLDPGYYTLDWVVAKGLKEIPDLSGSYQCGVSDVLQTVADRIAENTGLPFEQLARLDEGLRRGSINVRGKTIDLSNYTSELNGVWHNALTRMKNNVGDGRDFDRVYLVGGGARYLYDEIRALYPDHPISIASESVFANVRGFQAIGHFYNRQLNVA